mmetsp:Transcript_1540/g.2302  ORF Transcript_1540/g.2302 Transcript_1540/m.2302 type:complete len:89 (-) Transcript_1540:175-441(-)
MIKKANSEVAEVCQPNIHPTAETGQHSECSSCVESSVSSASVSKTSNVSWLFNFPFGCDFVDLLSFTLFGSSDVIIPMKNNNTTSTII